jgi:hypothetical protein
VNDYLITRQMQFVEHWMHCEIHPLHPIHQFYPSHFLLTVPVLSLNDGVQFMDVIQFLISDEFRD